MVNLIAKSACAGMLPLHIGTLTLDELDVGPLTSLAPFSGQERALSDALENAYGLSSPPSNRTTISGETRNIWFGYNLQLLMGQKPDEELSQLAAVTDQSDAWAAVQLRGEGAVDVLARLTPLDLRESNFPVGHTARTDIRHMMGSITRTDDNTWMILAFRGFAETLVHDIRIAMEIVSARS